MDIPEGFLENTDATGRMVVTSSRTGITYCIEPIDPGHIFENSNWNVGGFEGAAYKGSVREDQSLLNENNTNQLHRIGPGNSPTLFIQQLDNKRFEEGHRPKQTNAGMKIS